MYKFSQRVSCVSEMGRTTPVEQIFVLGTFHWVGLFVTLLPNLGEVHEMLNIHASSFYYLTQNLPCYRLGLLECHRGLGMLYVLVGLRVYHAMPFA